MTDKMMDKITRELGDKINSLPSENEMIHTDHVCDLVFDLIPYFEQRLAVVPLNAIVMWRSVDEEMPEIGQQVLLAPDGAGSNLRTGRLQRNNSWYFMGTQPMSIITHWMPLPEPPKAT